METTDDDEDLKLVQASVGLLFNLESALPKLLWRPSKTGGKHGQVHTRTKQRDLDYIINLTEPFQGEPQLLDARLKYIVPPIIDALLEYLQVDGVRTPSDHLTTADALCVLLYTLCKVRGYKVIVGFFNNEARYLEPILRALEGTINDPLTSDRPWQVQYILLLWLSHSLLTPFDLATISDAKPAQVGVEGIELPAGLPSIVLRSVRIGVHYLPMPTKAQDAAAAMLVRLVIRPDMQRLRLGDALVQFALDTVKDRDEAVPTSMYERVGPLRFLAGIAASADLARLSPDIYRTCEKLANDVDSSVASNAVAKKLMVKILRNFAILCLRSTSTEGMLLSLLENEGVLETVIDCLLRSLGDRDTPVRYAAAKALSLVVQELDPAMGHEAIQAVLDTFKEDLPRNSTTLDFRNADSLKWHGLTLALAHVLFKRTASPEQLPDIINALVAALQFEQRTSTGSSLGTNVRDAANFGIWSFSRRYTTDELLAVQTADILYANGQTSAIQTVAIQLVLSACLDPAGNIRRGSSAALQELIGRHPNQVSEGISLVQIVEYQTVGLRRRAMLDVSRQAAELHLMYWSALVDAALGWRGVGSPDVASREASAAALAKLSPLYRQDDIGDVLRKVLELFRSTATGEAERLHGLVLALAYIVEENLSDSLSELWQVVERLPDCVANFSPRILRSELPSAVANLVAALCRRHVDNGQDHSRIPFASIEILAERMLSRQEEPILQSLPSLARTLLALKRKAGQPLGCIAVRELSKKVGADSAKSTLGGAGRAIALGTLAPLYEEGNPTGHKEEIAFTALARMFGAKSVDWRVICIRAMQLAVHGCHGWKIKPATFELLADAVHRGLNDYTIDERGDVGSLVRLQAIACASDMLSHLESADGGDMHTSIIRSDIARLSLEKLDRVRLQASQCRERFVPFGRHVTDLTSVSTYEYFYSALGPLRSHSTGSLLSMALLEGCMSCAGIGAESILQPSRTALVDTLTGIDNTLLGRHLSANAVLLKGMLTEGLLTNANNMHPALELLAFLLDMRFPQRLAESDFKWRNLLSTVQKSHHKSNDIPKILAAVRVYRGLAGVPALRGEVLKKLISMLKTNPYPRVRASVAEALWVVTEADMLKTKDWSKPSAQQADTVAELQRMYAPT